jgi:hypothetical protein
MAETILEGIEALTIVSARGNLAIEGSDERTLRIRCRVEPKVSRSGEAAVNVTLAADAELVVPAGVALEIAECLGNLDIERFSASLTLGKVAGRVRARQIGSIAITGVVGGGCEIEEAEAIKGTCVSGDLTVERARSVSFDLVAGSARCSEIEREVMIENVGGRCRLESIGREIESERALAARFGTVSGKLRASDLAGGLIAATVGGKLAVDRAGGVAVGAVGGYASLRGVSGDVELSAVGGAAKLLGDFPAGKSWRVKSGGRISVQLKPSSSVKIDAVARRGAVRLYGIEGDLRFDGRDRLSGSIGAGECALSLETGCGDIVISSEEAFEREYRGTRFDWRGLGAPFEKLAEKVGQDIPEMVEEIVGAAGKIASTTGSFSGGIVREVARGVGDALREVERELADIGREVPEQAAERLSRLGQEIREIVAEAVRERRARAAGEAERVREHVREEAHRIREEIRRARAARRHGWRDYEDRREREEKSESPAQGKPERSSDDEIMEILAAVRAGKLNPAEADELIRAMLELEAADRSASR